MIGESSSLRNCRGGVVVNGTEYSIFRSEALSLDVVGIPER